MKESRIYKGSVIVLEVVSDKEIMSDKYSVNEEWKSGWDGESLSHGGRETRESKYLYRYIVSLYDPQDYSNN